MLERSHPIAVTITGPAKCGKSILAMHIARSLEEAGFFVKAEDSGMTKEALRYRRKNLPKLVRHLAHVGRADITVRSRTVGRRVK